MVERRTVHPVYMRISLQRYTRYLMVPVFAEEDTAPYETSREAYYSAETFIIIWTDYMCAPGVVATLYYAWVVETSSSSLHARASFTCRSGAPVILSLSLSLCPSPSRTRAVIKTERCISDKSRRAIRRTEDIYD